MAPQYLSITSDPVPPAATAGAAIRIKRLLAVGIVASVLLAAAFAWSYQRPPLLGSKDAGPPHTGDFCANADDYTKVRGRGSPDFRSLFGWSYGNLPIPTSVCVNSLLLELLFPRLKPLTRAKPTPASKQDFH